MDWVLLTFCLTSVLVGLSYCVPFASGDVCNIKNQSEECLNQPLCCKHKKFTDSYPSLKGAVNYFISFVGNCECKEGCKSETVKCKYGRCNSKKQRCDCDHCWSGKECDKYNNLYAPKFLVEKLDVTVSKNYPLFKQFLNVTSIDQDSQLCESKKNCTCADVSYSLKDNWDTFTVDAVNGQLKLIQAPTLHKYELVIVAQNTGDDSKKSFLKLFITAKGLLPDDLVSKDRLINHPVVHHRQRRTVSNIHPLIVYATPYLVDTFYFNKNNKIVFQVVAKYNGTTGDSISNIEITCESEHLSMGSAVPHEFDSVDLSNGKQAIFKSEALNSNTRYLGNLTTVVKNDISPLSSLYLTLTATALFDSNQHYINETKSTPIVYAVFPQVNVTTETTTAVSVYDSLNVLMKLKLPDLNYTLMVELTTNIEDYVFMAVENVKVDVSPNGINYNGSITPLNYSSQGNAEIDRVAIDFGFVSVVEKNSEREITIDFDVKLNDHQLVANGSSHWFGVGLQAGPTTLWVEQKNVEIIKIEPALNFTMTTEVQEFTRLYIGDTFNVTFDFDHAETSMAQIYKCDLKLSIEHLEVVGDSTFTKVNNTFFTSKTDFSIGQGRSKSIKQEFKVLNDITPLQYLPFIAVVNYENQAAIQKRPETAKLEHLITGTPLVTYALNELPSVTPGTRRSFNLTILLTKMKSSLQVEIVMPKANGLPVLSILSFKLVHTGGNIKGINQTALPVYRATTTNDMYDQAVLDLGTGLNEEDTRENIAANQIKLQFDVVVNDNLNITNGSQYWVGAGLVGKPNMVWVGQVALKTYLVYDSRPTLKCSFSGKNTINNIYEFNTSFKHASISSMFAYNVTFEYYLPPFMNYKADTSSSNNLEKYNKPTQYTLNSEIMYFPDTAFHSINATLDKSKSPKTGTVEFSILFRLSYSNKFGKRWHVWKSFKDNMEILPRPTIIPRDPLAKIHYYGRGFYVKDKELFLCMNQHVVTATPACYTSKNDGTSWIALDRRIGCILGYSSTNDLYAIARNQKSYLKYDTEKSDWFNIMDKELPVSVQWVFKNVETADTIGVPGEPSTTHTSTVGTKGYTGTGDGIYFRAIKTDAWKPLAKWRL